MIDTRCRKIHHYSGIRGSISSSKLSSERQNPSASPNHQSHFPASPRHCRQRCRRRELFVDEMCAMASLSCRHAASRVARECQPGKVGSIPVMPRRQNENRCFASNTCTPYSGHSVNKSVIQRVWVAFRILLAITPPDIPGLSAVVNEENLATPYSSERCLFRRL